VIPVVTILGAFTNEWQLEKVDDVLCPDCSVKEGTETREWQFAKREEEPLSSRLLGQDTVSNAIHPLNWLFQFCAVDKVDKSLKYRS
jgi:hypothetical protein